jgi:katanin p60 ATPase-containing subunit A1
LEGYSGSDIRLVCKEAAMKPLRRLMNQIELNTDFEKINWAETVDPNKVPGPGEIKIDDFISAMETTKSSA